MKALVAAAWSLFAVALAAGCGAGSGTPVSGEPGGPALVIQNQSSQSICFVYFSPTSQGTWGEDRLDAGETIDAGASRGFYVPSDAYDIKLEDCSHNVLLDRRGIDVAGDGVLLTVQ